MIRGVDLSLRNAVLAALMSNSILIKERGGGMKKLVRMATKIFPLAIIVLFLTAGSSFAVPDWSIYDSLFEEDQNTNYLGPGFGGQAYDVERLGMSVADGMLKFALQTGVNILQPAKLRIFTTR